MWVPRHEKLRIAGLVIALFLAQSAGGEIYRWVDAQGRVHFTQNLSQVPPDQRKSASPAAQSDRIQVYDAPATTPRRVNRHKQAHRVPFVSRAQVMLVQAKIDDAITLTSLVDSGASVVVVPTRVAQALGYDLGPGVRRIPMQTANGTVMQPVITLRSVELGSARVENVTAVVSDSMSQGLIGGSFINNFVYQVDAADQVIVLRPNDRVRSGASRAQWQRSFRDVRGALMRVDRYLDENELTDASRVRELESRRSALREELAQLEKAANNAGVPQAWRD